MTPLCNLFSFATCPHFSFPIAMCMLYVFVSFPSIQAVTGIWDHQLDLDPYLNTWASTLNMNTRDPMFLCIFHTHTCPFSAACHNLPHLLLHAFALRLNLCLLCWFCACVTPPSLHFPLSRTNLSHIITPPAEKLF